MADRFLIAPLDSDSGQQTNYKPWLISDQAFAKLNNVYIYRGRVRKRFGSRYLNDATDPNTSRFAVQVGTIGTPDAAVPGTFAAPSDYIGQQFSAGTQLFTVYQTGTPAAMLATGPGTGTFDTSTGAFVLSGTGLGGTTPIYWYPSLPVMGLLEFVATPTNFQPTIGFDTQFAYQYNGRWLRLDGEATAGAATWTGSDEQFFWGTTYLSGETAIPFFFVTNFNAAEPNYMRYYNSSTQQWNNFRPQASVYNGATTPVTLGIYVDTAQIITIFHNTMILLNTVESQTNDGATYTQVSYPSRVRWSGIAQDPTNADAWRQDLPGHGNALDATTTEAIVSIGFIKDRLIVYFEQSTWELVWTGNPVQPFIWQKINTELGAQSPFSTVPFDKVVLGIGNVGIHACNGANVERIDQQIPQTVFEIAASAGGPLRVYGVRDYFAEQVYWTYATGYELALTPYPQRVFVYNYRTNTWAFNDDSITAFGRFQPATGITWDSETVTWDDPVSWDSGTGQADTQQVIAGNQQGFTFTCEIDVTSNIPQLQITNLSVSGNVVTVTSINHNVTTNFYVYITGIQGSGNLANLNGKIFNIDLINANTFTFIVPESLRPISGTYTGGGVFSMVSEMEILTKEYNFYQKQGRNAMINKIDFMVDTTGFGQMQVNYFVSTSVAPLLLDAQGTGTLMGTGNLDTFPYTNLYPYEDISARVVHPVYIQADGEYIQLQIMQNDAQLTNPLIRTADFQMHFMIFYATPTASRMQ